MAWLGGGWPVFPVFAGRCPPGPGQPALMGDPGYDFAMSDPHAPDDAPRSEDTASGVDLDPAQLYQVVFAHGTNSQVPWTREYQYPGSTGSD